MKKIPISSIEDKADVFLLKRSFNNEVNNIINFKGIFQIIKKKIY